MHSMTGFGRGSATTDEGTATVEISCVNRKQAEVVLQGPRELLELELFLAWRSNGLAIEAPAVRR